MCSSDLFLALLAILFPPIAVWIKSGICTADSLINILLCTLGYLPGLLHAWYIISLYPESLTDGAGDYEPLVDAESGRGQSQGQGQGGRVTYYYVNRTEGSGEGLNAQGRPVVYGTVGGLPAQAPKPRGGEAPRQEGSGNGGEGSAGGDGVPPTYDQAVAGDNKVQR